MVRGARHPALSLLVVAACTGAPSDDGGSSRDGRQADAGGAASGESSTGGSFVGGGGAAGAARGGGASSSGGASFGGASNQAGAQGVDVEPPVADGSSVDPAARYPLDARHSPIDAIVASHLRAIVAAGDGVANVFIKVGDSMTVAPAFLSCLATTSVPGELEGTRAFFAAGAIGTRTPFDRITTAAKIGRNAAWPLAGAPSPLDQEALVAAPTLATVLYGANDMGGDGSGNVSVFGRRLLELVDALTDRAIVPLLSTIPPRADNPLATARVPLFNAMIRAVAQLRRVPLMDLHGALEPLPGHGLQPDGIHPTFGSTPCDFTPNGLEVGFNTRNLLTLEALHRVRGALDATREADLPAPGLDGRGTLHAPWVVPSLPFSDGRSTAEGQRFIDDYGCGTQDESGPEQHYLFDLSAPTRVEVAVADLDGVDVDLHLLTDGGGESCVARHDSVLTLDLSVGTYQLVVDTYQGDDRAGAYALTIAPVP